MIWLFCLSVDGGTVTCGIESLVHSRPNIGAKYDYMLASIWFIAVYKINTEQLAVGIKMCTNDKTEQHRSVEAEDLEQCFKLG